MNARSKSAVAASPLAGESLVKLSAGGVSGLGCLLLGRFRVRGEDVDWESRVKFEDMDSDSEGRCWDGRVDVALACTTVCDLVRLDLALAVKGLIED